MRIFAAAILTLLLAGGPLRGEDGRQAMRFAWPLHSEAQVELTDERSVGDERRTIVVTMRLSVEPDGATDRVVVRLSDAHVTSIDGASPGDADVAHTLYAVGRVMKRLTPTMVIGPDGRYLETRDLDRLVDDVLKAAGFPAHPPGLAAFGNFLSAVAAEDWSTWVGAWLLDQPAPGAWTETERDMEINGVQVPVHLTRRGPTPSVPAGRTRLEASVVYPSDAVRQYTSGFLIDMSREAKELGDDDPVASQRFLEKARYGPLTTTLTAELETATMRPLLAERTRTFSAVHGKHRVDGRERRTHRFTWVP